METFQGIYYDLSQNSGRLRVADSGMGWKGNKSDNPLTLESGSLNSAQWSRGARGYELKIFSRSQGVIQLDGFAQEDFDRMAKCLKVLLGVTLENKEHALRGWNWGKADFGRQELAFNVQNRPAFEIPYSEIQNTNLAGKNEVAVTLELKGNGEAVGTDGKMGGANAKGLKGGGALDQLTELRFYIPGTTTTKKEKEGGEDGELESEDEDAEEQSAVKLFHETLTKMADIGENAGDTYASFQDILHLTPRGRFDLDLYESSFRMRGKTYDYKVPYQSIEKIFSLPKPDEMHTNVVIALWPPLRQGQTSYHFLVMQFKREEEDELELNMTEELINEKFPGRGLKKHYEEPLHLIFTKILTAISGKRTTKAAQEFESHHNAKGVKCSVKASEGILYCLERAFLFTPKTTQYIKFDTIETIVFSRVGGPVSASRTFDITLEIKDGGEFQFSNINREEQTPLEQFFEIKGLKVRNEMLDEGPSILQKALNAEISSDEEVIDARADRGSADEEDESVDEDFKTESESDVAEEFDSAHESSGSDDEEAGAKSDPEERPKKKAKVTK